MRGEQIKNNQPKLSKPKTLHERYIKESPRLQEFGYSQQQIDKIICKSHSFNTVRVLLATHSELIEILNHEQIVKIAVNDGASRSFEALLDLHVRVKELGFSTEQIVKMVANSGGSRNLTAALLIYPELKKLGFNTEQVSKIAGSRGGSKSLNAVLNSCEDLKKLGISIEQITKIAAKDGGSKGIESIHSSYQTLKSLGFNTDQVIKLAGGKSLEATLKSCQTLCSYQQLKNMGFNADQVIKLAGDKSLEATLKSCQDLKNSGFSNDQVVNIVCHDGGAQNSFLQPLNASDPEPFDINQLENFLEELDDLYPSPVTADPMIFSGKRNKNHAIEPEPTTNKRLKM